jgi:tetratricopeptide (TPR) repeat protein
MVWYAMKGIYIFSYMKQTLFLFVAVGLLAAQEPDVQNVFRLAQAFEQSGEFERASQMYEMLVKKDSLNYTYFDGLRRMDVQLKRYNDAIAISAARLRKTPFDFSLRASIGGLFYGAGSMEQADSVWNGMILTANKNQMLYRAVASEQMNQRLFNKAIATFISGRADLGDPNLFVNDLAYLYTFTMDYENATREYLRLLRQNEQQFDFVRSRMLSYVSKDDGLVAATKVVSEEVKENETIPLLRLQLWLFQEDKRYNDAFTVAKRIEELINSSGTEIFQFAEQLFREHEFSVAEKAYKLSLENDAAMAFVPSARFGYARCVEELSGENDSSTTTTQTDSGTLRENRQGFSSAISLYEELANKYPHSAIAANALYRIGWIRYKRLFDLDGAQTMFDSVLTVAPAGPMRPAVLSTIGEINVAQGKLDDAAKNFVAMSSSPYATADQKTEAQFDLAEIQFFKANFDSAQALLKPLTENLKADESNDALLLQYFITKNTFQYRDALKEYANAELLARQFKVSEAAKQLSDLIDLYPVAPLAEDALLKKADYSIQLHQFGDALAAYHKLLDEYKTSIEKDKTQFKIGELYQFYMMDKQKAIEAYEVILEKYPYSLFTEEARKRIRHLRGDSI